MIDPLFTTVEYALGGLQMRTEAVADNLANANTPRYQAKRVAFEDALASALRNGKAAPQTTPYHTRGLAIPDHQGNTVHLETEMTDMTKTALARQTITAGFNYKIGVYKIATGNK
jgi:flagellar basal-body rod protein FlgB